MTLLRAALDGSADRYLLSGENLVISIRRHWVTLARPAAETAAACALLLLGLAHTDGESAPATLFSVLLVTALLRFGWYWAQWHVDRFIVTDRRVMLVTGVLTKKVAVMPLRKVTDMTFEKSWVGRLLGYGSFVMESAGQTQALRRVDFLGSPDWVYQRMSLLIFPTVQVRAPAAGDATHED